MPDWLDIPVWLIAFLIALPVGTFVEYWAHRIMHAWLLKKKHAEHHRDGWGQGWLGEFFDYAVGTLIIMPVGFLYSVEAGIGFVAGALAYAAFAAYAHQLQHEKPELCFWMVRPVHYLHHYSTCKGRTSGSPSTSGTCFAPIRRLRNGLAAARSWLGLQDPLVHRGGGESRPRAKTEALGGCRCDDARNRAVGTRIIASLLTREINTAESGARFAPFACPQRTERPGDRSCALAFLFLLAFSCRGRYLHLSELAISRSLSSTGDLKPTSAP